MPSREASAFLSLSHNSVGNGYQSEGLAGCWTVHPSLFLGIHVHTGYVSSVLQLISHEYCIKKKRTGLLFGDVRVLVECLINLSDLCLQIAIALLDCIQIAIALFDCMQIAIALFDCIQIAIALFDCLQIAIALFDCIQIAIALFDCISPTQSTVRPDILTSIKVKDFQIFVG